MTKELVYRILVALRTLSKEGDKIILKMNDEEVVLTVCEKKKEQ